MGFFEGLSYEVYLAGFYEVCLRGFSGFLLRGLFRGYGWGVELGFVFCFFVGGVACCGVVFGLWIYE